MAPNAQFSLSSVPSSLFFFFFSIAFPLLYSPVSSSSSSSSSVPKSISKIYAFGDSYTDTGNLKTGLPNGMTFFHRSSNRLSDGRLVIDFVAESLSLPYLPPYLDQKSDPSKGVNFAVSGSTAIGHDFYVKNNITLFPLGLTPLSISSQLDWFREFLGRRGCGRPWTSSQCQGLMSGALFWVGEVGGNDYAYTFGSSVSVDTVKALAVKSVSDVLQALLSMGAKHIVVQGLSPIGCLPLSLILAPTNDRDGTGCVASANKQSYTHNSLLLAKLQQLRKLYPQAVISYADHWNAYRTVMKNTQRYGFIEPFKACCGTPAAPYNFNLSAFCGSSAASKACSRPAHFINWDGVHLTEAMYRVVADMFLHHGYCLPSFR